MAPPSDLDEDQRAGGFYAPALAHVHAGAFEGAQRPAFAWLLGEVRQSAVHPVLHDLGCGSGTFLAAAIDAGLSASGSDISPAFATLARARGLDVAQAHATAMPWPRETTAITALGEVLSYLHDGEASLFAVAAAAARTLPKGGCFIADLIGSDVEPGIGHREGETWRITSDTEIAGDLLTRRIRLFTDDGTSETVHLQRILDPARAAAQLEDLGFDVTRLDAYGPHRLLPGRFAVRARKT